MSYSEWADFIFFITGDTAMYLNDTYVALQPNIGVVPTSLAPNWVIVPPPSGSGVSSLQTLTGNLTLVSKNMTITTIGGTNIDLDVNFPPATSVQYPYYSTGNAVTKPILAGGTQQGFQTFTLPYTFGINSPRTLIQIYFFGSVVMTTTGGNDLLIISGNVLDSSSNVLASAPVSPFSVYVDSLNKPTGCDGILIFEVALLASSDVLTINLEAKSSIASDAYIMTMAKPVGIIQRTS